MPFIQAYENPYICRCFTRNSPQAYEKLLHPRWTKQYPVANRQAGQREHRNKQDVLASWPKTVLKMNPRIRGRPMGPTGHDLLQQGVTQGIFKGIRSGSWICSTFQNLEN